VEWLDVVGNPSTLTLGGLHLRTGRNMSSSSSWDVCVVEMSCMAFVKKIVVGWDVAAATESLVTTVQATSGSERCGHRRLLSRRSRHSVAPWDVAFRLRRRGRPARLCFPFLNHDLYGGGTGLLVTGSSCFATAPPRGYLGSLAFH
jgi:hypothetical protein